MNDHSSSFEIINHSLNSLKGHVSCSEESFDQYDLNDKSYDQQANSSRKSRCRSFLNQILNNKEKPGDSKAKLEDEDDEKKQVLKTRYVLFFADDIVQLGIETQNLRKYHIVPNG